MWQFMSSSFDIMCEITTKQCSVTDLWLFWAFWGQSQGTAPYLQALHTNFLAWKHVRSEQLWHVRRTLDVLCQLWMSRKSRGPRLCHLTFPLGKNILHAYNKKISSWPLLRCIVRLRHQISTWKKRSCNNGSFFLWSVTARVANQSLHSQWILPVLHGQRNAGLTIAYLAYCLLWKLL